MDESTIEMFKDKERKNLFATYNHIEMVMVEEDHAVFRLNIQPESKNSYGMVHGGAIYAMADNATGFAAHTDGRNYVTQTSALHFLRNQSEGEIQADARVRHRGHSTCLVAVDILGEDEKLLATGEFTFFCVDPESFSVPLFHSFYACFLNGMVKVKRVDAASLSAFSAPLCSQAMVSAIASPNPNPDFSPREASAR